MEVGILEGARVTLRAWSADDAACYVAARDDTVRVALHWLGSHPVTTVRAVTADGNDASAALLTRAGFRTAGRTEHPRLGPSTRWELEFTPAPAPR